MFVTSHHVRGTWEARLVFLGSLVAHLYQGNVCFGQEGIIRACGPRGTVIRVGSLAAVEGSRSYPLGGSQPEVSMIESRSNGGGRCVELGNKRTGLVTCRHRTTSREKGK